MPGPLSSGPLQPLTKMSMTQEKIEWIGENLVITREGNRSLSLKSDFKDYVCAGLFSILDKIAMGIWYISEIKHQS